MNLAQNKDRLSSCLLCPTLGKNHVVSEGPASADVFIIHHCPGLRDVENESPFSGPIGEMVEYFLDEAGLNREDVYLANAVKCVPPNSRQLHPEEIETCFTHWLSKELAYVKPSIIVLMGKDAWASVARGKFEFEAGKIHKTTKGTKFLMLYSPAYYLRRGEIETFVNAGGILKDIINGKDT